MATHFTKSSSGRVQSRWEQGTGDLISPQCHFPVKITPFFSQREICSWASAFARRRAYSTKKGRDWNLVPTSKVDLLENNSPNNYKNCDCSGWTEISLISLLNSHIKATTLQATIYLSMHEATIESWQFSEGWFS